MVRGQASFTLTTTTARGMNGSPSHGRSRHLYFAAYHYSQVVILWQRGREGTGVYTWLWTTASVSPYVELSLAVSESPYFALILIILFLLPCLVCLEYNFIPVPSWHWSYTLWISCLRSKICCCIRVAVMVLNRLLSVLLFLRCRRITLLDLKANTLPMNVLL